MRKRTSECEQLLPQNVGVFGMFKCMYDALFDRDLESRGVFSAHDADRATLLANIDDHKRCNDVFEPLAVGLFHARRMLHVSKARLDILQPSYVPFAYMEQISQWKHAHLKPRLDFGSVS